MNEPPTIKSLANELWNLSVVELKEFRAVLEGMIAAKEAVELAERRASDVGDGMVARVLEDLRDFLADRKVELSGPQAVLLGSQLMHEEGQDLLDARRLNILLESFHRKPANSTSIIEKLSVRDAVHVEDDGPHTHKKFRLTPKGREEAMELLEGLRRRGGGLAVVGE